MSFLKKANAQQRAAITHSGGPALVLAGAGTGKTLMLALRVAHLIKSGVKPHLILLLTFTHMAARQMLCRVGDIVGEQLAKRVVAGTFHGLGLQLIRRCATAVGRQPDLTVMDRSDSANFMHLVRSVGNLDQRYNHFPQKTTLASIHSRVVNGQRPLKDVLRRHFTSCLQYKSDIAKLFARYATCKRSTNVVDHDDLLLLWLELLRSQSLSSAIGTRFEHILIDEFQDVCTLQNRILIKMHQHCPNIFAVGDDCQAIYGFREAHVGNMLRFPAHFPNTTIFKLEQNCRSSQPILNLANAITNTADEQFRKTLWSTRKNGEKPLLVACRDMFEEAEFVADRILECREEGTRLAEQVALFRASHNSNILELELGRRDIPFRKFGGMRFADAAHVKDVVAMLRILENPRDEVSWFRVLQLLPLVGSQRANSLIDFLGVRVGTSCPVQRLIDHRPILPVPCWEETDALRSAFADSRDKYAGSAVSQIRRLRIFYDRFLELRFFNADDRQHDLDSLEALADRYKSRSDILADPSLDPTEKVLHSNNSTVDDHDDILRISTIHSFKGLEVDTVYLIQANDGTVPSNRAFDDADAMEEERRIVYVAVTRPRHRLIVSYATRQLGRGYAGNAAGRLSRFVTGNAKSCFEQISPRGETHRSTLETSEVEVVDLHLSERLRD